MYNTFPLPLGGRDRKIYVWKKINEKKRKEGKNERKNWKKEDKQREKRR